jgi:hypothetical protein
MSGWKFPIYTLDTVNLPPRVLENILTVQSFDAAASFLCYDGTLAVGLLQETKLRYEYLAYVPVDGAYSFGSSHVDRQLIRRLVGRSTPLRLALAGR